MGLSSLTNLGTNTPSYTPYTPLPRGGQESGTTESEVIFRVLGNSPQNQNVLVFAATTAINTASVLSVNPDGTTIDVSDQGSTNSNGTTVYYSIDMGLNTVTSANWTLTLNATLKDKSKVKWVFVKGTSDDLLFKAPPVKSTS